MPFFFFKNYAALTSHTVDGLRQLVISISQVCKEFGLTMNLKKTNDTVHGTETHPNITSNGYTVDVVENFINLGSTISSSLSIHPEINSRIVKAATVMVKMNQRVWNNSRRTEKTRLHVYQACVPSTLLYGSETWTTCARQEKKLNSFHIRNLRRILQIKRQEKVPDAEMLERASINSLHTSLSERRLRRMGKRPHP